MQKEGSGAERVGATPATVVLHPVFISARYKDPDEFSKMLIGELLVKVVAK
jgi:hypothetical protein